MKFFLLLLVKFRHVSPSMRREWIEMTKQYICGTENLLSPSMRREWIEMSEKISPVLADCVSLHAEGVD